MPRKAWFRDYDGWWYCQVGDKQIKLAKGKRNKAEAIRSLRQIQAQNPKATPAHLARITVAQLRDAFLNFSRSHHDPQTTDWFGRFLGQFCTQFGHVKAHAIEEDQVVAWLNAEKRIRRGKKKDGTYVYRTICWSSSTKNAAARCVTQLLNWAMKRGLVKENPLKHFKKPPMRRRQRIRIMFNVWDQYVQIAEHVDGQGKALAYSQDFGVKVPIPSDEVHQIRITDDGETVSVYLKGPEIDPKFEKTPLVHISHATPAAIAAEVRCGARSFIRTSPRTVKF